MKVLRLTWTALGTEPRGSDPDATGRSLFGLHLAGSLMALLAVWPPGWRLGEPVLAQPFDAWWGAEVVFLGLAALQFGAGRWRRELERPPGEIQAGGGWPWLFLLVASVVPIGVAAYRVNPRPAPSPALLAATLVAALSFFTMLGRALGRAGLGESSTRMAVWGLFLFLAAGVWLPGARTFAFAPGWAPLPALGPVPFPIVFHQPPVPVGSWQIPLAAVTAAVWSAAGLVLWGIGRMSARQEGGSER